MTLRSGSQSDPNVNDDSDMIYIRNTHNNFILNFWQRLSFAGLQPQKHSGKLNGRFRAALESGLPAW